MSTKEKRIEDMKRNPKNRTMDDMVWLLCEQAGCRKRGGGRSSHFIFQHPELRPLGFPDGVNIPFKRPIRRHYVENALAYYEALREERENRE